MTATRRRNALVRLAALALVGALPAGMAGAAAGEPALVLGIYPFAAPREVEDRFNPLASFLALATGQNVVLRISRDYTEHLASIARGELDLAFIGPANLALLMPRIGRWPLLGKLQVDSTAVIESVIAVRADSPLQTLTDLRGRRVAFTDPHSSAGYHLPRAMLRRAGVREVDLGNSHFVGSFDNAALAVLAGDAEAAPLKQTTFRKYTGQGLRVLVTLPAIPEHAFMAGPRVSAARAAQLATLLHGMADHANGRAIVSRLQPGVTRIVAADWTDYRPLAALLQVDGAD